MKKNILLLAVLLNVLSPFAQISNHTTEWAVPLGSTGDTVRGTLVADFGHPKKFRKCPLAIIIPGSGPTDRNGNSAMLPGPNDSYHQLADSLFAHGICSFRYDKPGVGESISAKAESQMRFEDNVEVVKAIVGEARKEGFRQIYLLGHSEGSLIGMLTAQQVEVKGFISLAGPGKSFYNILKEQLNKQLSGDMLSSTLNKIDSIKEGYNVTRYNPVLASLLRESVQPYLRSTFHYEPEEEIAKLKVPVLILQGGEDMQVSEQDAGLLKAARPQAAYHFYPQMNHVLKMTDGSEEQNRASYFDPDFPLNPKLAADIRAWMETL